MTKFSSPKKVAGGIPAVWSALKISLRQMGILRAVQSLGSVNQSDGFDCPGCAWPDPDDKRSLVEFCENGAKAVAEEATRKVIGSEFFRRWSVSDLRKQSDFWLSQQGRLTEPMWLASGKDHYESIAWEKAFELIAEDLQSLSSPDEAIFYTSGRTSNEAAFLYQLFVRAYGTNNLPDCSNLCHESSGYAMSRVIGSGKGSVRLEDFGFADCIVVIGQNPGTNHPRMLTALQEAARRGANIISINPLPEAGLIRFKHPQEIAGVLGRGTPLSTHFLQVKINGDVAALKGLMKAWLETWPIHGEFIEKHTEGFLEFSEDLKNESWQRICESSGLTEEEIRRTAKVIAQAKRMICCWAMGLTQHENAVANIQEVVNLLLLGGHFGRRGAGACPVRGHSNVQGDRTMGIWEAPTEAFLTALEKEFSFNAPRKHGFNVVQAIRAMHEGRARLFFALGGNFLSASPDTLVTAEALQKCRLTVHVSTKLNPSHLIHGAQALILPTLGRSEADWQDGVAQFVTVENSMGVVHRSEGKLKPASKLLKSEVAIVCELAMHTLKNFKLDWKTFLNYDRIRDHISRVIPGFENFNERIHRESSFLLPHPVRDTLRFATPNGKAIFSTHPIPSSDLAEDEYLMMTIRSHDQYNTTIYGMDDRYRGVSGGRKVVLMNSQDMKKAKFKTGDKVSLSSQASAGERKVEGFSVLEYDIPSRCVATYFPETNILVPLDRIAKGSETPASKSIPVRIFTDSQVSPPCH